MKNVSTRVSTLLAGLALATSAAAQPAAQPAPPAAAQPAAPSAGQPAGPPAARPATAPLELAPDAPDRYVVVRGDTLWDISARFLKKPWRWPEIWQLNREQIRNPHWIYPGDVVYLDASAGAPRLRLGRSLDRRDAASATDRQVPFAPVERYGPRARATPLPAEEPIPTVEISAISSFMNRPLVVDEVGLAQHPRIFATEVGRLNITPGDLAYVRGMGPNPPRDWFIYRPGRALLDPDTRKPIAWEVVNVGLARLEREGEPASVRVLSSAEEIEAGARLMPAELEQQPNWVPHAPDAPVAGRIVSVARNSRQAGKFGVVAISAGAASGLEPGHALVILQRQRLVVDRETREYVTLPAEPIGHLLVFRVFDKISYGLIMAASQAVEVGDGVTNP